MLFDKFSLYGLSYVLGFALILVINRLRSKFPLSLNLYYSIYLGIFTILGGRLGYILFYNLNFYLENPKKIFALYEGGMAFHGALLGLLIGVFIIGGSNKLKLLDNLSLASMLTIPFGRLCNFLNGELVGRITDSKFGIIFLDYDLNPRFPSQLFEAFAEGPLILGLIFVISRFKTLRQGSIAGLFALFYGILRFLVEFTREADPQMGYFAGLSLGQYFCLGQIIMSLVYLLALKKAYFKL